MPSTTIQATNTDGKLAAKSNTYSSAANGANASLVAPFGSGGQVGQAFESSLSFDYEVYEYFLDFDTSGIPDNVSVDSVTLSLNLWGISGTWTLEAFAFDCGTLTTADWRTPSDLSSLTKVATLTSAAATTGAYSNFTEVGTNFRSAINLSGVTSLVLAVADTRTETAPSPDHTINQATFWDPADGTRYPKLTVTYTVLAVTGQAALTATATILPSATRIAGGLASIASAVTVAPLAKANYASASALATALSIAPLPKLTLAGVASRALNASLVAEGNIGVLSGVVAMRGAASFAAIAFLSAEAKVALAATGIMSIVGSLIPAEKFALMMGGVASRQRLDGAIVVVNNRPIGAGFVE